MEITLNGEKYQIWFNNFAVFELQSMYGIEQKEILQKVSERAKENYLLLLSDLIKAGIKGHCLAKGIVTPEVLKNINEHIATANMGEVLLVWEVFFDIMGGNIKEDKKKEEPKMKKQKPQPLTKTS